MALSNSLPASHLVPVLSCRTQMGLSTKGGRINIMKALLTVPDELRA